MMTREERTLVNIKKAEAAGYVFLGKGMGRQDEALTQYRSEGYDVRGYYTQMKGEDSTWQWVMYGKKKGQRKSAQPKLVNDVVTDLGKLTVKELKKRCMAKKISGYSKMNKEQMIESLLCAC